MNLITEPQNGKREGRKRRDRAVSHIEKKRAYLTRLAQRLLLTRLLKGEILSSDAIRAEIQIPRNVKANFLGAAVRALKARGLIIVDGVESSRFPQCHGRNIPRWRLIDATAAEAWLQNHPPLLDPPAGSLFTPADFA